jgi:hypothetical protein
MANSSDDLMSQLDKFKEDYYNTNSKNLFFKKSQKNDMAQKVSSSFNLEDLIKRTVFIIPDTHHIIIDYSVFKHYAHEDNYADIINYSKVLMRHSGETHGKFVIHVNIQSLTITSIERHRKFIEVVNDLYLNSNDGISEYFSQLYLYYPPSVMDSIFTIIRPCIDASILNKMSIVSKKDSEQVYPQLLEKARS